jgi:5-methylcytosine-specific restriction endonuclease McrA
MDDNLRLEVQQRAGGRCEYCRLPEAHVITPFQIEHIVARQHGVGDTPGNLAYACLRCNLHKGPNLAGIDPKTKKLTKLFNPRRHKWERHFRWNGALVTGKTALGRTTVAVLAMNDPERVALRQELLAQGLL